MSPWGKVALSDLESGESERRERRGDSASPLAVVQVVTCSARPDPGDREHAGGHSTTASSRRRDRAHDRADASLHSGGAVRRLRPSTTLCNWPVSTPHVCDAKAQGFDAGSNRSGISTSGISTSAQSWPLPRQPRRQARWKGPWVDAARMCNVKSTETSQALSTCWVERACACCQPVCLPG